MSTRSYAPSSRVVFCPSKLSPTCLNLSMWVFGGTYLCATLPCFLPRSHQHTEHPPKPTFGLGSARIPCHLPPQTTSPIFTFWTSMRGNHSKPQPLKAGLKLCGTVLLRPPLESFLGVGVFGFYSYHYNIPWLLWAKTLESNRVNTLTPFQIFWHLSRLSCFWFAKGEISLIWTAL